MKKFNHPFLKSQKIITSQGIIELDKDGSAEVEDATFDHLMKIPANKAHQDKLAGVSASDSAKPGIVPTLEEFVKAGYKAEIYGMRFCGFQAGDPIDEKQIELNRIAKQQQLEEEEAEKKRLAEEERLRLEAGSGDEGLKEADLKLLDIKELKQIALKRKIQFSKNIAVDDLILLIINANEPAE